MNIGSVVQVGGAVQHNPLPLLAPHNEPANSLEDSSSRSLDKNNVASVLGGFIGGGQLSWRVVGPTIEVLDPYSCRRQAAWTFGATLHNPNAKITCVCGIGVDSVTHIVVGIDLGSEHSQQGMVAILSLRRSRITRAFQFTKKVINVCMITCGDHIVDPSTLALELRSCEGLLAVATEHASLYLVDIALDLGADNITSDEVSPASFSNLLIPDPESCSNRNEAIDRGCHPMLCLSNTFNSNGIFKLLGPDDNVLYETPSHTVNISSLMYIPQIASLAVGYSFGSFQILNLSLIIVDCASPYEENLPPVLAFSYQEPEHDPRSFVYLWVCRSISEGISGIYQNSYADKAFCSLYGMSYEKKEWIEGHGLWYQDLQSISQRFEFEASPSIGQNFHCSAPSKIFAAMTVVGASKISGANSPLAVASTDMMASTDEESDPVPELSLCLFCWEGSYLEEGRNVTQHYIAIFDINQWYQAQMPSVLRILDDALCPYMSFHKMDKVPKSMNEKLLSAASKMGSWSRYCSKSTNESTWYPSSLSYELHLLTSEGLVTYRCPSIQQCAITSLMQQGPGAIVDPHIAYNACMFAGITPSDNTTILNLPGSSTVCERKQLLDIALGHNLLPLIIQCVVEFSEGKFSHVGCSLQLLLEWVWDKVRFIKQSYDILCSPLFSYASEPNIIVDTSLATLHQHLAHLSQLCSIIETIKDNAGEVSSSSASELDSRYRVASILKLHLQAVLWFYHCGLLPQCHPEEVLDGKVVPFPDEALQKIYDARRLEIAKLGQDLMGDDFLLIDCIISESGSLLSEIWHKDTETKESYPPDSLQALLSMYLLPKITTSTKNRIVQYLFLDLASLLSDNFLAVAEELVQFPSSFSMSPSIIKLTQAFWLIDQKDFETGLSMLLDPLVNPEDISSNQHRKIVKSFLLQGQENHALTYIEIRQPPEMSLEDIQLNLTVFLANGRIREAFHFQRLHRVENNAEQLLNHLFTGVERLGRLESIVHLPLSDMEEKIFLQYLKLCGNKSAQDILLIYYLQQSRFGDIAKLNDGFKGPSTSAINTRSALVQSYLSHLPNIRSQINMNRIPKPLKKIYHKPQPLSAKIRHDSLAMGTPLSKAKRFAMQEQKLLEETFPANTTAYTPFRSKAQRNKEGKKWQQNTCLFNPALQLEIEPQKKNSPKLVFPTQEKSISDSKVETNNSFILNHTRQEDSFIRNSHTTLLTDVNPVVDDVTRVMEDILATSFAVLKDSSIINKNSTPRGAIDMISLLKTPPVSRKKTKPVDASMEVAPDTPQSILKVRKILQRPQSPTEESFERASVPTFPAQRSLIKSLAKEKSLDKSLTLSESGSLTPKFLRFDLPSQKRLSVNDDNEIIANISSIKPIPLVFDNKMSPQKRKLSIDQEPEESNDKPTPRKPLPSFTETSKTYLPFDLQEDREESDLTKVEPINTRNNEMEITTDNKEDEVESVEEEIIESNDEHEKAVADDKSETENMSCDNEFDNVVEQEKEVENDNSKVNELNVSAEVLESSLGVDKKSSSLDNEEELSKSIEKEITNISEKEEVIEQTANVMSEPVSSTNVTLPEESLHKPFCLSVLPTSKSKNTSPQSSCKNISSDIQQEFNVEKSFKTSLDFSPFIPSQSKTLSALDYSPFVPAKLSTRSLLSNKSLLPSNKSTLSSPLQSQESGDSSEKKSVEKDTLNLQNHISVNERSPSKSPKNYPDAKKVVMNLFTDRKIDDAVSDEDSAHEESFHSVAENKSDCEDMLDDKRSPFKERSFTENVSEKLSKNIEDRNQSIREAISFLKGEKFTKTTETFNSTITKTTIFKNTTQDFPDAVVYMNGDIDHNSPAAKASDINSYKEDSIKPSLVDQYILKFSDSEDDDVNEDVCLSRADTEIINKQSTTEIIDNTIVNEPTESKTTEVLINEVDSEKDILVDNNSALDKENKTITHLPSEFENLSSMYFNAGDLQVINSVMKEGDDIANDFMFKKIQKPTFTPKKSKNIDNLMESSAKKELQPPILHFSDPEDDDVFESDNKKEINFEKSKQKSPTMENLINSDNTKDSAEKIDSSSFLNNNVITKTSEENVLTTLRRRSRRISGSVNESLTPSKSLSSEVLTPARRSRRVSSSDGNCETSIMVTTPLRRNSRRNSLSTPIKNLEESSPTSTPVRRSRRTSLSTPLKTEIVKDTIDDVAPDSLTPLRRSRRNSESTPTKSQTPNRTKVESIKKDKKDTIDSSDKEEEEESAIPNDEVGVIEEAKTPKSKRGRKPSNKILTPTRRSARKNAAVSVLQVEALQPIAEENKELEPAAIITPKKKTSLVAPVRKTPTRSNRRKSLNQTAEVILETIEEDGELKDTEKLSPLSTTAIPTVRSIPRAESVSPKSASAKVGRGRVSASVSPRSIKTSLTQSFGLRRSSRKTSLSQAEISTSKSPYKSIKDDGKLGSIPELRNSNKKDLLTNVLTKETKKSIRAKLNLSVALDREDVVNHLENRRSNRKKNASGDNKESSDLSPDRLTKGAKDSPALAYEEIKEHLEIKPNKSRLSFKNKSSPNKKSRRFTTFAIPHDEMEEENNSDEVFDNETAAVESLSPLRQTEESENPEELPSIKEKDDVDSPACSYRMIKMPPDIKNKSLPNYASLFSSKRGRKRKTISIAIPSDDESNTAPEKKKKTESTKAAESSTRETRRPRKRR